MLGRPLFPTCLCAAVTCQRRRIVPGLAVCLGGGVIGCQYCEFAHNSFKVACLPDSHPSSSQRLRPPAACRDVFLCFRSYFFVFLCQGWSVSMPSLPARASGFTNPWTWFSNIVVLFVMFVVKPEREALSCTPHVFPWLGSDAEDPLNLEKSWRSFMNERWNLRVTGRKSSCLHLGT